MKDITPSNSDKAALEPDTDLTIDARYVDIDVMTDICRYVANGGSSTRWCVLHKVDYATFLEAVREDREFESMFIQACMDREEWFKENLLTLMYEITAFDARQAYDENGNIKPMNELPRHVAAMVKRSRTVRSENKNGPPDIVDALEFYDKQKAIDQLGKHLQLFVEKPVQTKTLTLEETIRKSKDESKNS